MRSLGEVVCPLDELAEVHVQSVLRVVLVIVFRPFFLLEDVLVVLAKLASQHADHVRVKQRSCLPVNAKYSFRAQDVKHPSLYIRSQVQNLGPDQLSNQQFSVVVYHLFLRFVVVLDIEVSGL